MILSVGCKFTFSFSDTDNFDESSVLNSNNDISTTEASKKRTWLILIVLTMAVLYKCYRGTQKEDLVE